MRKSVAATAFLGMALTMAPPVGAQENISVFDGDDDDGGPIMIGGEAGGDEGAGASGGGLVIEGVSGASASGSKWGAKATLPFIEMGGVMFVPARVSGKKVYFIFDTGAGLTTLTPAFAKKIGASPGPNAPSMTTMTANGPRPTRLSMARSISLEGVKLGPFTFSTCAPCGGGTLKGAPIVGLLGRNVISRIDFRVDDEGESIELRAKPNHTNRRRDIEPWLSVDFQPGKSDEKGIMRVKNTAPRTVRNVTFELVCQTFGGDSFTQTLRYPSVGQKRSKKQSFDLMKPGLTKSGESLCARPQLDLKSATW